MEQLPERAFDVGNRGTCMAVTMAGGNGAEGFNSLFSNIYSTFLQRAYDQIMPRFG